ncbi:MAG: hypothetical protein K0Q79_1613 [Flavipsychrobacter sp.]|nr:hypothetical protein [Flavipsychrobacter sp.]
MNARYLSGRKILLTVSGIFALLLSVRTNAQQLPPRPISVSWNPSLGLRFGAFFATTSGGTVSVSPAGVRTATGNLILADFGYVFGAASFEIVAAPGTQINLLNGPTVTLNGSAGGSVSLTLGSSSPSSPFVTTATPPAANIVNIGGTLTVGSSVASPPGAYSGSFYLTFFQE